MRKTGHVRTSLKEHNELRASKTSGLNFFPLLASASIQPSYEPARSHAVRVLIAWLLGFCSRLQKGKEGGEGAKQLNFQLVEGGEERELFEPKFEISFFFGEVVHTLTRKTF